MKPDSIRIAIGNEDISLLPNDSEIVSRSEIDLSTKLSRNNILKYPIVLSPMDSCSDVESCVAMNKIGAAGILHRFMSLEERIEKAKKIKEESGKCYVAVGLNDVLLDDRWEFVRSKIHEIMMQVEVDCFFLDVAHGTQRKVYDFIRRYEDLKDISRERWEIYPDLITGNTLTYSSVDKHFSLGSDGVRNGIGVGCFTPYMKVITTTGSKNICEVKIGDYVYTHRGNAKQVLDTLKRIENEKLIKINSILCTENHEFFVIRKDKMKLCSNESDIENNSEWIQAKNLTKDYFLIRLDDI